MNNELNTIESTALERTPATVALEIRTLKQQAQVAVLSYAIEIGRRLEEAKAMLPHGEWGDWLKREVDYSQSTAQNLMKIFREYGADQQSLFGGVSKSQALGNLTYTKALRLLALPEEERESFAQEHDVESLSTRELDRAIRERDEALQRQTEEKNRADGLQMKLDSAQKKASFVEKELEEARRLAAEAKDEADRKNALVYETQRELDELKARPVDADVIVEKVVDEEAVEQARAEAVASMKAKLDEATRERDEAVKKRLETDKSLGDLLEKAKAAAAASMQDKLDRAIQERDALKAAAKEGSAERVRELEKQLAAADPENVGFKLRFGDWQERFEALLDDIAGAAQDNGERAGKWARAVVAALDKMREEASAYAE